MRLVLYLIVLMLVLALGFAGAVAWVMATEQGVRFVAARVPEYLPELTLTEVSGTLAEGVHVNAFEYVTDEVRVTGRDVFAQADPWSVLGLEALRLLQARAAEVTVTTLGDGAEGPPPGLPRIPLVLRMPAAEVARLEVNGVGFEQISAAGTWDARALTVRRARFTTFQISVDVAGSLPVSEVLRPQATGTWRYGEHSGEVEAEGTLDALKVHHIYRGAVSEGEPVISEGTVNLSVAPRLSGDLHNAWPALALEVSTQVEGEGERWQVAAEGTFDDLPFRVRGTVSGQDGAWHAQVEDALLVEHVSLAGQVALAPELSGDLRVEVGDLSAFFDGLQGRAGGRVQLNRSRVRGELESPELSYGPVVLALMKGRFDVPFDTSQPLSATVNASSLTLADTELSALRADVNGPLNKLNYTLDWQDAHLAGTVADVTSDPRISIASGARLSVEDFVITNSDPIAIRRGDVGWRVSDHCWQGLGTVCIESTELADLRHMALAGRLEDLPLGRLNPWLPLTLGENARLDGTWDWQRASSEGQDWSAVLALRATGLDATYQQTPFTWPDVQLDAEVNPHSAAVKLASASDDVSVHGALAVQGFTPDAALQGELDLTLNLAALPAVVEQLKALEGQVVGQARVSGTAAQPDFELSGTWAQGRVHWGAPHVELKDIAAEWQATPQSWQVQGQAVPSQGGTLNIQANGDGYSREAVVAAEVKGEGIPLTSELWSLTAAPEVTVKAAGGKVDLRGKVAVPKARVEVDALPESLPKTSPDVRVVGRAADVSKETFFTGRVQVNLGKDVRLKLFGLDVGLRGDLNARVRDEELVSLNGELEVYDGLLSAMGQKLKVESGRVLFSGDPNNPYVDLTALREIEDQSPTLKVGLRITGRADDLNTTVYSEPTMSETRALSFLVLGRDFNEGSQADSQQLVTAAIGFGLKQSQGVVQELRGALGLDELSALSAAQNDVAIVAGKRVTKDLYVRYTYNALSAVGALVIRYHMTDRWRLEASNEASSSMDLLYEFTR